MEEVCRGEPSPTLSTQVAKHNKEHRYDTQQLYIR